MFHGCGCLAAVAILLLRSTDSSLLSAYGSIGCCALTFCIPEERHLQPIIEYERLNGCRSGCVRTSRKYVRAEKRWIYPVNGMNEHLSIRSLVGM